MAAQSKQTRCYLLKLPAELRLLIWEALYPNKLYQKIYILETTFHVSRPLAPLDKSRRSSTQTHSAMAPLLPCRMIYNEALPIIYGRVNFEMVVSGLEDKRNAGHKKFPEEAYFLPHVRHASVTSWLLSACPISYIIDRAIKTTHVLTNHLPVSGRVEYLMSSSMSDPVNYKTNTIKADVWTNLCRIQWPGKTAGVGWTGLSSGVGEERGPGHHPMVGYVTFFAKSDTD